ncbi:hypothetical protein EYF80_061145 [Liparis tanakae]|uniref:Uncharacterized protein n=1 Tax=Liparis tanakae TaxID=230148 RepID=A0A4Z2EID5_9TELE|nr:hypothetical protein EYF80_061145 [Liparis tanakae]
MRAPAAPRRVRDDASARRPSPCSSVTEQHLARLVHLVPGLAEQHQPAERRVGAVRLEAQEAARERRGLELVGVAERQSAHVEQSALTISSGTTACAEPQHATMFRPSFFTYSMATLLFSAAAPPPPPPPPRSQSV